LGGRLIRNAQDWLQIARNPNTNTASYPIWFDRSELAECFLDVGVALVQAALLETLARRSNESIKLVKNDFNRISKLGMMV
jgi:hypothetical protein